MTILNIEAIKARLAAATPGPWAWREDMFRYKYMQQLNSGKWRAKPGKDANRSWVMLLTGPMRSPQKEFNQDDIIQGYPDEYDFPHIIALRWGQVRSKCLVNVTPNPPDADLIAHAPTDIRALLEEVDRLRNIIFMLGANWE